MLVACLVVELITRAVQLTARLWVEFRNETRRFENYGRTVTIIPLRDYPRIEYA